MKEQYNLQINRFYDKEGNPTCAINFPTGDVCIFYATQSYGCHETCWFADKNGKKFEPLRRRKNSEGTLIPNKECPVWKDKKGVFE